MRYADVTIKSVADLLRALKKQSTPGQLVWFRGQSVSTWSLVPSLARNAKHLKAESALLKRFMQNAVPHLDRPPVNEWEWMFMMQHHRAPTRLLDWSEGPLTALYFAVSEDKHSRRDAAVWCLDPIALNSDEARIDFPFPNEVPAFGIDKVLNSYLPSLVEEAPNVMNAVAIVGPRNTARMVAQLGVFTVNHRDHKPIEALGKAKHVWRWVIPSASKKNLQQELSSLGYTPLTLFPELDRVADLAKELLK
ncbi:FRG domain-containing protein [Polaromonas sp. JS666]|uniref:FRG domain-containing protein n=1 Tax=Polaromonas sp. (strain JS666 / ATCC BAA-500) TaxID=296591 RepID=UPI00088666FA|nr:FRG domain-containing protein [Polaromonas sp. JS666]SDO19574.1 FRG domain-containing protein [Polaromonas sp. JS666]